MNWTPPEGTELHHCPWYLQELPQFISQDNYGHIMGLYPWPDMPHTDEHTLCLWHIKPKPCNQPII